LQIAVNAGNNQSAWMGMGTAVPIAPSVIVSDASNNPVSGVSVTFAVASGGGSLAASGTVTTNNSGIATSPAWTLGTTAGANTLTATSPGLTGSPLTFTATAVVGASTQVWTSRTSAANNSWNSVAFGNGIFVAVAQTGTAGNRVMTSPDGINWTSQTAALDVGWNGIAYGNGLFVAVTGGALMTSPDGINWTLRTVDATSGWHGVAYGNGLWVAVSGYGSGNRVMTSPDGISWTLRASTADNNWFSVAYGNGLWVALATDGTVNNQMMTSPDGINWTARTSAAVNEWTSVAYGNGLWVAVARVGTGNLMMTSTDGINWTSRTPAANNKWRNVAYGNGLWVAVAFTGTGNRVMTSPDGITWTSRTTGVTVSVTNKALTSNVASLTTSAAHGITVGMIAVITGVDGTFDGSYAVTGVTSTTFTYSKTNADVTSAAVSPAGSVTAESEWVGVTYGNGLWAAVSRTGTGNRVMTMDWAPTQIAVNGGNTQSIPVGTAVATAPSVIVRDANGNPVEGVGVSFAVASGGGSITGANATTNASGIATVGSWTLGATAGANSLTATVGGLTGSPVTFTATGM